MLEIRERRAEDDPLLLDLWLRAVRATHTFLTEEDVALLLPLVRDEALPGLEVWVCEEESPPLGFIGLTGAEVNMLFVDPGAHRRGVGRQLLDHAKALRGCLSLDVNEQNPGALAFYFACGFRVVGRSELDGQGRPFLLLHLTECP